jgi:hypothetical protein
MSCSNRESAPPEHRLSEPGTGRPHRGRTRAHLRSHPVTCRCRRSASSVQVVDCSWSEPFQHDSPAPARAVTACRRCGAVFFVDLRASRWRKAGRREVECFRRRGWRQGGLVVGFIRTQSGLSPERDGPSRRFPRGFSDILNWSTSASCAAGAAPRPASAPSSRPPRSRPPAPVTPPAASPAPTAYTAIARGAILAARTPSGTNRPPHPPPAERRHGERRSPSGGPPMHPVSNPSLADRRAPPGFASMLRCVSRGV